MRFIILVVAFVCASMILPTIEASAGTLGCPGSRANPNPVCPAFNPVNGHYYALSGEARLSWTDAKAAAEEFTYRGAQGHLATITSEQEYEFLLTHLFSRAYWIGASDAEVEGEWRWAVGPEAGTLFWSGGPTGTPTGYANWAREEPNDLDDEDFAILAKYENSNPRGWNDLPVHGSGLQNAAYLVEFSVPEPSTYALLLSGGAALAVHGGWRRRRN